MMDTDSEMQLEIELTPPTQTQNQTQGTSPNPTHPPPSGNKPPIAKKTKIIDDCWTVFEPYFDKLNVRRGRCKYCEITYAADSRRHGTSNMLNHINHRRCKKYPFYPPPEDGQTELVFSKDVGVVSYTFSVEECTKALAEMVILDELSFRFVEGIGFRRFCNVMQPKYVKIPSRMTIMRKCMSLYAEEKIKLKKLMKGLRISMTTDCWTSNQNLNYMCLTAHFIDSEWKLQKRIIGFCMVEDHKGETIGKVVETILRDWELDSYLTLTVDNASSNTVTIKYLIKASGTKPKTILNHEFLHVRCCAHILNLIVREGMFELDYSIKNIREAVRYVRSSQARTTSFKDTMHTCSIKSKALLSLDVPTRWNSTYKMLESAIKFETVFDLLSEHDENYKAFFLSDSFRPSPTFIDWQNARCFVEFLKLFYDSTKKFSGTLFVTTNLFFDEIVIIWEKIDELCNSDNEVLKEMALKMKTKFLKYWGINSINILLYVAVVLDPRKKLQYLTCYFSFMYTPTQATQLLAKVNDALTRIFAVYNDTAAPTAGTSTSDGPEVATNHSLLGCRFQSFMAEKNSSKGNELERYLKEDVEEMTHSFDILAWWKSNTMRFKYLSEMARHVLAVPVSTVASESAFSTSGRVLDQFRSSLSPSTVEALICTQNWLKYSLPIDLNCSKELVEHLEAELGYAGLDELSVTSIESTTTDL